MSPFPKDIVIDILLRLPAKSILRFKRVSKLWYQIINDPYFINLHLQRHKLYIVFRISRTSVLHLCDFDTFNNPTELGYPFKDLATGVNIEGSCRGLLCISKETYPFTIIFYNPTTQTHKTLPSMPIKSPFRYYGDNGLANYHLGFGYDPKSEDYKCVMILLRLVDQLGSFKSQVKVYSLRADSWTRGAQDVPYFFHCRNTNSAHLGGIVHWYIEDDDAIPLQIVSYNLGDESFGSVPLPNNVGDRPHRDTHLGVVDECLCLTVNYVDDCDVWIMKEYGVLESWTRVFKIDKVVHFEVLRPIFFLKNRKQLLVNFPWCNVSSVDLENWKITKFKLRGLRELESAHICLENLLMLKDDEDKFSDF